MVKLFFIQIIIFCILLEFSSCKASSQDHIQAKDIIGELQAGKNVFYSNKIIKGTLDFTSLPSYRMSSNANKVDVIGAVTFDNCQFEEDVIAFYKTEQGSITFVEFAKCLSFTSCIFQKRLLLREIVVNGLFNLTKSQIQGEFGIEGGLLQHSLTFFTDSKFKAEARFQRIKIRGNIDLLKTEFWANASFQLADFEGNVMFADAIFNKSVDFSLVSFSKKLILNNSLFYGDLNFSSAVFNARTEIINAQFKQDVVFDEIKCWDVLKLNNSSFASRLSFLKGTFFCQKPELRSVTFENGKKIDVTDAVFFEKKPLFLEP